MPAFLETLGVGLFAVQGELDFDTVETLWREAGARFREQPFLRIDLKAVKCSTSAGVALLVEWLREARTRGQELHFVNIPPQMFAIIRVADLEDLLPLS
jgi:phospholipid transport system transporter-binding protein